MKTFAPKFGQNHSEGSASILGQKQHDALSF